MDIFILTDLEGAARVTRFVQTRERGPEYAEAKMFLTGEVNAAIQGARAFDPNVGIHVWDGHGGGGLVQEHLLPVKAFLPSGQRVHASQYFREYGIAALLFVGQHAMSYTFGGNLCHTMSSRAVEYYALNGALVGEFGLYAAVAGDLGIPTIFLSGDDKACAEAQSLIPGIVTVATKVGLGWERAASVPEKDVHAQLALSVAKALAVRISIPPHRITSPVTLDIAVRMWPGINAFLRKGAQRVGSRVARFCAPSMEALIDQGAL